MIHLINMLYKLIICSGTTNFYAKFWRASKVNKPYVVMYKDISYGTVDDKAKEKFVCIRHQKACSHGTTSMSEHILTLVYYLHIVYY